MPLDAFNLGTACRGMNGWQQSAAVRDTAGADDFSPVSYSHKITETTAEH